MLNKKSTPMYRKLPLPVGAQSYKPTAQFVIHYRQYSALLLANFTLYVWSQQNLYNTTLPKALIFTDSLTAIHILKHTSPQHPFAHDIWNQASTLSTYICIAWVPGHSTSTGNNRLDCAAKEAASISPIPELLTSPKDYLAAVRLRFSQLAKERFTSLPQFTDNLVPTWNNTTSRHASVVICCVRTGHTHVTHDFLLNHVNPPSCPVCNVSYTIPHIFLICPKYNYIRSSLKFPPTLLEFLSDSFSLISFLQ